MGLKEQLWPTTGETVKYQNNADESNSKQKQTHLAKERFKDSIKIYILTVFFVFVLVLLFEILKNKIGFFAEIEKKIGDDIGILAYIFVGAVIFYVQFIKSNNKN